MSRNHLHPWTFFLINPQLSWVCWLWRTFRKFVNFKLVYPQVFSCLFVFQVSSMFVDFQVSSSLVCQFSSYLKYGTLNSSSTRLWIPNFIQFLNLFWNSRDYDFFVVVLKASIMVFVLIFHYLAMWVLMQIIFSR